MSRSTEPSNEDVLLFKRGKPNFGCLAAKSVLWHRPGGPAGNMFAPRVGPHSSKPDAVRHKIVRFAGNVPRIELFARYTEKSTCTGRVGLVGRRRHGRWGRPPVLWVGVFHKSGVLWDPPCLCEKAFGVECPEAASPPSTVGRTGSTSRRRLGRCPPSRRKTPTRPASTRRRLASSARRPPPGCTPSWTSRKGCPSESNRRQQPSYVEGGID